MLLAENLHNGPEAHGMVCVSIQAVHVHGHVNEDSHRSPHQRPIPRIPLRDTWRLRDGLTAAIAGPVARNC